MYKEGSVPGSVLVTSVGLSDRMLDFISCVRTFAGLQSVAVTLGRELLGISWWLRGLRGGTSMQQSDCSGLRGSLGQSEQDDSKAAGQQRQGGRARRQQGS